MSTTTDRRARYLTDSADSAADAIADALQQLRMLSRICRDNAPVDDTLDDPWNDAYGDVWLAYENAKDIRSLFRDGELSQADLDAWLCDVEEAGNTIAMLPRYED